MSDNESKQLSKYEALLIDLAKQPPPTEAEKSNAMERLHCHRSLHYAQVAGRAIRRNNLGVAGVMLKLSETQLRVWLDSLHRSGKLPNKAKKHSRFNRNFYR